MAERVVIVGGGFVGLNAARRLQRADVTVIEDTVIGIEPDAVVTTTGGIDFDHLIIGTGATHHYFGNDRAQLWCRRLRPDPVLGFPSVGGLARDSHLLPHRFSEPAAGDDPVGVELRDSRSLGAAHSEV